MIALLLALCGALPDSVDAAPPFVPAPTAVAPFAVSPQTPRVASGSDSGGLARLSPMAPVVLAPVTAAELDSNGGQTLSPSDPHKPGSGVNTRHPFVLGAAGAVGGGFVGGVLGSSLLNNNEEEIIESELIGAIYGTWIGSAIGATWGVVHERAPEKSGKSVLVPLLGGVVGSSLGVILGFKASSFPIGFLIMASASSLGALLFDGDGPGEARPTTAIVPLLAPQRTGLALHTRF